MENEQEFIDFLHERYYYKDGELFYKKDIGIKGKKEAKVGSTAKNGYTTTSVNNKAYLVHRLIYAMHKGYFPKIIDHIDRNRANNKIENLREATRSENNINAGLWKNNTSGYKGVYYEKKKWVARVKRTKNYHVGTFDTPEEAHQARVEFIERELNEKHLQ